MSRRFEAELESRDIATVATSHWSLVRRSVTNAEGGRHVGDNFRCDAVREMEDRWLFDVGLRGRT